MAELGNTLAAIRSPRVEWLIGRINAVTGDTVTLEIGGGLVPNVGCSDQYVPIAGDVVHALSWAPNGVLVLCSNNQPGTPPTSPVTPGSPLIVAASSRSTYSEASGTWAAGTTAGPTQLNAWFYAAGAFSSLGTAAIGAVEIEVTRTSGGPIEFVALANTSAAGTPAPLAGTGWRYGAGGTPVGVTTWVPLPLEWGQGLISGAIRSIGIGDGLYSGVYSGTGRVRISPLA